MQDEAGRWYVPDLQGRAQDLERLRERALLREWRTYVDGRGRLKLFRSEAVRAGFGDAWRRRDYAVTPALRVGGKCRRRGPPPAGAGGAGGRRPADGLRHNASMRMETA